MKRYLLLIYSFLTVGLAHAQQADEKPTNSRNFVQKFSELPKQDITITTDDPFNFNFSKEHGHIQGIQLHKESGADYLYMTRSSPEASYMIKTKLEGRKATVVSIDTLMLAPYKHPGGFQIFEDYLAVGIEDDDMRNTSRVTVYNLKNEGKPWDTPLHVVKRDGKYERVTAGCVGMTRVGKNILIVVGNWHSRDLDFYVCPLDKFKIGENGFQLIQSINIAQVSKEGWSDPTWRGYQNINLFSEGKDNLYLVGFDGNGTDLYELKITNASLDAIKKPSSNSIQIKKLNSVLFEPSGNASFGSGAGIFSSAKGEMMLLAAPSDVGGESTISVFSKDCKK